MTSKEIEELAGHRPVSAWVIKLVNDAIAIERERLIAAADRCIVCEQRRIRHETTTKNETNS